MSPHYFYSTLKQRDVGEARLLAGYYDGCNSGKNSKQTGDESLVSIYPKFSTAKGSVLIVEGQNIQDEFRAAPSLLGGGPAEAEKQRKEKDQEGGETPVHTLSSGSIPVHYASADALDIGAAA
jgi:hypothetical protein